MMDNSSQIFLVKKELSQCISGDNDESANVFIKTETLDSKKADFVEYSSSSNTLNSEINIKKEKDGECMETLSSDAVWLNSTDELELKVLNMKNEFSNDERLISLDVCTEQGENAFDHLSSEDISIKGEKNLECFKDNVLLADVDEKKLDESQKHSKTSVYLVENLALKRSGNYPREILKCNECGVEFTRKYLLYQHLNKHSGRNLFPCNLCEKSFIFKHNLDIHIKMHTKENPYECPICKKSFKMKTQLSKHKLDHGDFKPYGCDQCDRKYKRKSYLDHHKQTHSDEWGFECDVCKKILTTKSYLTVHKRIHTGEKPFSCDICYKKFSDCSKYRKHIRNHKQ